MIESFLKQAKLVNGIEVHEDFSLKTSTTLGLISIARTFIKVSDENGLEDLISLIKSEGLGYLVLGKGSNIILPEIVTDVVIKLNFPLPRGTLCLKR